MFITDTAAELGSRTDFGLSQDVCRFSWIYSDESMLLVKTEFIMLCSDEYHRFEDESVRSVLADPLAFYIASKFSTFARFLVDTNKTSIPKHKPTHFTESSSR